MGKTKKARILVQWTPLKTYLDSLEKGITNNNE
jgi:hypothetical protein